MSGCSPGTSGDYSGAHRLGKSFGFWSWVCLAVASGLALAVLVAQTAGDPVFPRKLAAVLVLLAPLFAVGYGLGRMLWGKPLIWRHLLELGGVCLLLAGVFAVALRVLRKA